MPQQRPILLAVQDVPEFPAALKRACLMAERLDAPLKLISAIYDNYVAGRRFGDSAELKTLRRSLMQRELDGLRTLCRKIAKRGITVSARVAWDRPRSDALARQVMALDPLMLIVPAHRIGLVDRMLLAQTDWQVLARVSCPVLRVPERDYGSPPVVAVAVDPMHANDKPAAFDDRLLEHGAMLAEAHDAELHVLHVVPDLNAVVLWSAPGGGAVPVVDASLQDALEAKHREACLALADKHGIDHDRVHVASGMDTDTLNRFVRELDADVLVAGVVSRSRVSAVLVGNTAARLIGSLECDLFAVKPEGFESPVEQDPDMDVLSTGRVQAEAGQVRERA